MRNTREKNETNGNKGTNDFHGLFVCFVLSVCFVFLLPQQPVTKVLVFSKTSAFRHDSIPDGIAAIRQLGEQNGFSVDAGEDASIFNDAALAQYRAVVFLSTTGEVLNDQQQGALERFIGSGGGYVGIHSASDTEYNWPWYSGLVGAYFQNHPAIQTATIRIEDATHPSTSALPVSWARNDEWYNFRSNPRGRVKVLATLDESTYGGGAMGSDHPIVWCRLYGGGRSWYTAGGHTKESFSEPLFRSHLLGGIEYAAGLKDGACSALVATSAASFKAASLAADSIASVFGSELAPATETAAGTPLPTTLAGTSLVVRDSMGVERFAQLFFVSSTQINFLIPGATAAGRSTLTLQKPDGTEPSGDMLIETVSPGLFSANADGKGAAAALVLRVSGDNRSFEQVAVFDTSQNKFIPAPINLGPPTDELFLVLFGTGLRFASSQSTPSLTLGGSDAPILFIGPQAEFAGLDQVNARIPRSLAGRGAVDLVLTVGGKITNTLQLSFN